MGIKLAKTAGFCFGVNRAVDRLYEIVKSGEKVCTLGPIIHNPQVIEDLKSKGVVIADSIDDIPKDTKLVLRTHGVEKSVIDKLKEKGVDLNNKRIEIREYINDMARCLSAADLVICRAGASSLSEFEALGKPSILIPSPNVTENHQFHNAMALVNNGAAVIIEEMDLNGKVLGDKIDELFLNREELEKIGENAKKMAHISAAGTITDIVLGLIK